MSISTTDLTLLLLAVCLLLLAAHGLGRFAVRLHQPRVAGEIVGGLLLGPTLFGLLAPGAQRAIFAGGQATKPGLAIAYQLGLLLLMYGSGAELRSMLTRGEAKAASLIAVLGNVVPFAAGLALLQAYDASRFYGPAHDRLAFGLVFGLALAVTSIPVIARIMADLGILGTRFARVVLSVAVLEDLMVYVLLNVALARVAPGPSEAFGLPSLLGLAPAGAAGHAYHVAVTLAFFGLPALLGPGFVQRAADLPRNFVHRSSPIAFQLLVLFALTAAASFLGVSPAFGALIAGILASDLRGEAERARGEIRSVAGASLVPLYFALVGLRLDLVRHFEPGFFAAFFAFACATKALSSYAGARLARENRRGSLNLAVALNARGGPGIVLASIAFDAKIINEGFYTILVMTALVTSVAAGSWLCAILRRGEGLLDESRPR